MANYIIPSDNWEQQLKTSSRALLIYYIIPSDNWEQQPRTDYVTHLFIISYQAITGNNNEYFGKAGAEAIISYQAITGNNNMH